MEGRCSCDDATSCLLPARRPELDTGSGQGEMLYCNKSCLSGNSSILAMPTHLPHQHRHPGRGHPTASISPSILRMSVLARLAISAALIGVLWAAVAWAMR